VHILIVSRDAPLAAFLARQLREDHFVADVAPSDAEALRLIGNEACQLVILDLDLPEDLRAREKVDNRLQSIRAGHPFLPIIVLTSSAQTSERVKILDQGADDCLTKPFSYAELSAHVRGCLRRLNGPAAVQLKVHDLELDRVTHTVRRGSSIIDLTQREFALLEFLMQRPLQPITRIEIAEHAWKSEGGSTTNAVDVYINYLRKKIDSGFDRPLIRTIRGVGYQIGGE
jgi:two-component system, OmpR family, response regulator